MVFILGSFYQASFFIFKLHFLWKVTFQESILSSNCKINLNSILRYNGSVMLHFSYFMYEQLLLLSNIL